MIVYDDAGFTYDHVCEPTDALHAARMQPILVTLTRPTPSTAVLLRWTVCHR